MSSWTSKQNYQDLFAEKSMSSIFTLSSDSQGPEISRSKERRMSDSATQTGKSLQSGDSGNDSCSLPVMSSDEITADWSPSHACGLSTPPSSQMFPSTSNSDLLSYNNRSHCSTPAVVYTPGQSPATSSLGGDIDHHGYSSSPSILGSRGKTGVSGWMNRSREEQLTRTLYSALAQHSSESVPAAIVGHQTSTPKEPVKCENDKIEGTQHDDECNSLTSPPSSELSAFKIKDEQTTENFAGSCEEQFDSSDFNVSPKEEYSLVTDEALTDVSKFPSSSSGVHQNHYPAHTCDLLTAFPQLLQLFQSEQEHSGHSSMADGDDITSSRLQQQLCGASPVEILDNYLKTGKSVHCGELSR